MDGTIVDTEPYWMAAETRLVESFGGTWSDEQVMQLIGNGLEESARVLQAAGVKMGVQEIVNALTESVRHSLATEGVPFRPGAREMLLSLHEAGIPMALVTMSMRAMAEDVVALIDFPAFDVIVGGDEVERPKPYPEPYLHAARLLGVDIADTVALEDSQTGLRSAVASGAVSIGVPNLLSLDNLGAHAVWDTLAGRDATDIVALFAQHRGKPTVTAHSGDHA